MISTVKNVAEDKITGTSKVELFVGEQVYDIIKDDQFQKDWDILYQKCIWSTVFQNRKFVTSWYQIYKKEFIPLIVRHSVGHQLVGLLTMTIRVQAKGASPGQYKGRIVGAGHYEAEYQSWLSTPEYNDEFIHNALLLLTKTFPHCNIFFRYLVPQVPLSWIENHTVWKKRSVIQAYRRPMMRMDDPDISKIFRKKEFKNKFNRLKRQGNLVFEHVHDPVVFAKALPVLIEQFEFRQRAMFNKSQFTESPEKALFLTTLFEQGILHATILKIDEEIVASILSIQEGHWYHLGAINTHSPIYGNHSPGFVHFILLGEYLSQDNQTIFDLTPGGDAYKERMATHHDYVKEFCIPSSSLFHKKQRLKYLFHKYLMKYNIRPMSIQLAIKKKKYDIKHWVKQVKYKGLKAVLSNGLPTEVNKDKKLYALPIPTPLDSISVPVSQNNPGDLLHYDEDQYGTSPWSFLEDAMHKYDQEIYAITWSADGLLLGCAWIANPDRWTKVYGIPFSGKPHPVIVDIRYHPSIATRLDDFISTVILKVSQIEKHPKIYISIHPKNKWLLHWVSHYQS